MSDDGAKPGVRFISRGLGRRPRLRLMSATLWASFLGAALSTVVLLFLPDNWNLPLASQESVAVTFLLMWLLALVPALLAGVLAAPREPRRNP